jgi:CheY-like chemotaxis protein
MKRILICDDEPHIVEGLRHLLRGPQRTIVIAANGIDALERVAESKPDLLIIDVMMPEMSGLEVVANLRSSEACRDLPIIILTAKGQAEDAVMAQEVWGATVMTKPFQPASLRQLVSSILEGITCP